MLRTRGSHGRGQVSRSWLHSLRGLPTEAAQGSGRGHRLQDQQSSPCLQPTASPLGPSASATGMLVSVSQHGCTTASWPAPICP